MPLPSDSLPAAETEPEAGPGISPQMSASTRNDPTMPPDEAAFDLWLHGELSRLYDDALHEPVPESLLRILRETGGGKGEPG